MPLRSQDDGSLWKTHRPQWRVPAGGQYPCRRRLAALKNEPRTSRAASIPMMRYPARGRAPMPANTPPGPPRSCPEVSEHGRAADTYPRRPDQATATFGRRSLLAPVYRNPGARQPPSMRDRIEPKSAGCRDLAQELAGIAGRQAPTARRLGRDRLARWRSVSDASSHGEAGRRYGLMPFQPPDQTTGPILLARLEIRPGAPKNRMTA